MPHYEQAMKPQEVLDYDDQILLENASRVFAVFDKSQINKSSMRVQLSRLKVAYPDDDPPVALDGQPFAEQAVSQWKYGRAFLVASNILATAQHVLSAIQNSDGDEDITEARFVRKYIKRRTGHFADFTFADVFDGIEVLAQADGSMQEDWALIKICPTVSSTISPIRQSLFMPKKGDYIYCLGHPSGLPMKVTFGQILAISNYGFIARIDTYSGNSGSPVFDAISHRLVGMISSGETDYNNKIVNIISINDLESTEKIVSAGPIFEALNDI